MAARTLFLESANKRRRQDTHALMSQLMDAAAQDPTVLTTLQEGLSAASALLALSAATPGTTSD
jgi:hypothetical protein